MPIAWSSWKRFSQYNCIHPQVTLLPASQCALLPSSKVGHVTPVLFKMFSHYHFCITELLFVLRVVEYNSESIKASFCMGVLICIICLFKPRIISSIFKNYLFSITYSISVLFIWKRNLCNFLPCLSIFSPIFSKLSHILGHTLDW